MNETVDPNDLTSHPKNEAIYGDINISDRFVDDIQTNGVTETLTVTEDSHFAEGTVVISGHRRQEGAIRAGENVPVEYQKFGSAEEELDALLRANDYRKPTFRQKMGELDALLELHEAGHQDFGDTKSERRERLGDRIDIGSGEQVRKAQTVWDAAKDGDELASKLVDDIDQGDESVHSGYTRLKERSGGLTQAVEHEKVSMDGSGSENEAHQDFGDDKSSEVSIDGESSTMDDSPVEWLSGEYRTLIERYNERFDADLSTDLSDAPTALSTVNEH